MAIVYAGKDIHANVIHPGPIDKPMQGEWGVEIKAVISESVPLGRPETARDIAYCGLFPASDESG